MPAEAMKCPIDDTVLQMTDRQGIEVDYCPECRGIWLDRGELDKLIEKSMVAAPSHEQSRPSYSKEGNDARRGDQGYTKKSKKESFLGYVPPSGVIPGF